MHDIAVIGGGHNGLIAASLFARAGLSTLVLERSDRVGGCARTGELAPGFRCPTLAHTAAIDPAILSALALERHGLRIIRPAADVVAPTIDGRALTLWHDPARAGQEIGAFSAKDAGSYPRFLESFRRVSTALRALFSTLPPSIDSPDVRDAMEVLKTGRAFRALGRTDAYRLLRWMPMAVADFAAEWFESEPLRAAVAAGGVLGSFLGPWSAGSAAVLLLLGASEGQPVANGWMAGGGTGMVADALSGAARRNGVEIRTGAEVVHLEVSEAAVTRAVIASGERIAARVFVSNADPKRTLGLVDPVHFDPAFLRHARNFRARGTLAKVNYAVSALPRFSGLGSRDDKEQMAALSGRVRLARDIDAIEQAFDKGKYGEFAAEPWIELTIPSISDPALAPAGSHVISAYVQYAPYHLRGATWDTERDRLGDVTSMTIAQYAPRFEASIVAREVITPLDLEHRFGLTGGDIFHGELALDQWFVGRPLLGFARYTTPIRNLFLCGSGTHPGTGLNGRSGALAAKTILRAIKRSGRS
jgi:phytoene dehydrogenase-like protein